MQNPLIAPTTTAASASPSESAAVSMETNPLLFFATILQARHDHYFSLSVDHFHTTIAPSSPCSSSYTPSSSSSPPPTPTPTPIPPLNPLKARRTSARFYQRESPPKKSTPSSTPLSRKSIKSATTAATTPDPENSYPHPSSTATAGSLSYHGNDEEDEDEEEEEDEEDAKRKGRPNTKQVAVLWRAFNENPLPSTRVRAQLAHDLKMTPRAVQIWFQNRRQWFRTKGVREMNSNNGPSTVRKPGLEALLNQGQGEEPDQEMENRENEDAESSSLEDHSSPRFPITPQSFPDSEGESQGDHQTDFKEENTKEFEEEKNEENIRRITTSHWRPWVDTE